MMIALGPFSLCYIKRALDSSQEDDARGTTLKNTPYSTLVFRQHHAPSVVNSLVNDPLFSFQPIFLSF